MEKELLYKINRKIPIIPQYIKVLHGYPITKDSFLFCPFLDHFLKLLSLKIHLLKKQFYGDKDY